MRDTTATMTDGVDLFAQVAAGSRSQRLIVDVFYDDEPIFTDLPVTDWTLTYDLESELKSTTDLTAVYTSTAGESLSPRGFLDALAPYGQQVNVLIEVAAGPYTDTLQLGRFRVNQSPDAQDSYFRFADRTLTAGSLVKITADDLLSTVKRAGFHWPEPPLLADTTWGELQRITGLPIAQNLPDAPVPAGIIYQPKDGGRLAATQMLMSALGGIAVTNSFGELTAVPFTYSAPVATLDIGENGRVLSVSTSLDSDGLYNTVVGTYQATDGTPLFAVAYGTGPLAPDGPFGPYTYYDTSDTVTTQAAADARAESVLTQLQTGQTYRITLSCLADYRLEPGDVVTFTSQTGAITGRIISLKFTADGRMEPVLDVRRDVSH